MRIPSAPERLLRHLGVEAPEEIDLEAIARHLGVIAIRRRPLEGCEARIVGCGEHAIISVKAGGDPARRRFSICHELGHWCLHRGETLYCQAADIRMREVGHAKERVANTFAADLLLPPYLVEPLALPHHELTLKLIDGIGSRFGASRTATAIQLVKIDHCPAMVVCHGRAGRLWHVPGPRVPGSWSPRVDLDRGSLAFDMVFGAPQEQRAPRRVGAHLWFGRRDAERYEILEQSFGVGDGQAITLLTFKNARMFDDGVTNGGWR